MDRVGALASSQTGRTFPFPLHTIGHKTPRDRSSLPAFKISVSVRVFTLSCSLQLSNFLFNVLPNLLETFSE